MALANQTLTARRAAMQPRHIGFGPGFIEENQSPRIELRFCGLPKPPRFGDVGT